MEKTEELENAITNALLFETSCPVPWTKFSGYCLIAQTKTKMTVFDAEFWCNARGGFVVYFLNKEEHDKINEFARLRFNVEWYHIGLRRAKPGSELEWSSGQPTGYLTTASVASKNRQVFASRLKNRNIEGSRNTYVQYFICRRPN